jgi:hypothetical protein
MGKPNNPSLFFKTPLCKKGLMALRRERAEAADPDAGG